MHRDDLRGGDSVFLDHDVARKVAHRDHPVGFGHACPLDLVNLRVDVFAAAVEFGRVHVYDQRLARYALGRDAGVVGQPVVGMDQIELPGQIAGYLGRDHRVAGDFLHQIGPVFAREAVPFGPSLLIEDRSAGTAVLLGIGVELLGSDVRHHVRIDMDKGQFLPHVLLPRVAERRLDLAGVHDPHETLIFISVGFRNDENHFDAVLGEPASQPVGSGSQSSCYMGRELPTEHQYSHGYCLFPFVSLFARDRFRSHGLSLRRLPQSDGPSPCPSAPWPSSGETEPETAGARQPEIRPGA